MNPHDMSLLRKQLLANGYSPMPGKVRRPDDWASFTVTEALIESWAHDPNLSLTTCLRMEKDLVKLRIETDDLELPHILWDMFHQLEPHLKTAPVIYGADTNSISLLVRSDVPFGRMTTSFWLCVNEEGPRLSYVEAVGSLGPYQLDAYGRIPGSDYDLEIYWEPTRTDPLKVTRQQLPLIPRERLQQLIDLAEARLQRAGWLQFSEGPDPEEELAGIELVFEELSND